MNKIIVGENTKSMIPALAVGDIISIRKPGVMFDVEFGGEWRVTAISPDGKEINLVAAGKKNA